MPNAHLNSEVTKFLDALNHPFRKEIEQLRELILCTDSGLIENIKWNGPNYCFNNADRITMKIQPPKQVQLIFHRGAKVKAQPGDRLIEDASGLLAWKENDRAIASFKTMEEIENSRRAFVQLIKDWIRATA